MVLQGGFGGLMRGKVGVVVGWILAAGLGSAQVPEDPVMAARAQRSAAGHSDADLPPVPRTIMEPPPLPPPELHPRDMKGSRASRAAKRASRKPGKATKGKGAKPRKAPAARRRAR
jgi:hypothetical protein